MKKKTIMWKDGRPNVVQLPITHGVPDHKSSEEMHQGFYSVAGR